MKRFSLLIFVNIVLALFQVSFFPDLLGLNVGPNLILAYAFSLYLLGGGGMVYSSALIGGIFLDLMSTSTLGLSSLVMVGLLLVSYFIRNYIFRGGIIYMISVLVSSYLYIFVLNSFEIPGTEAVLVAILTLLFTGIFYFINRHTIFRLLESRFIQIRFKDL